MRCAVYTSRLSHPPDNLRNTTLPSTGRCTCACSSSLLCNTSCSLPTCRLARWNSNSTGRTLEACQLEAFATRAALSREERLNQTRLPVVGCQYGPWRNLSIGRFVAPGSAASIQHYEHFDVEQEPEQQCETAFARTAATTAGCKRYVVAIHSASQSGAAPRAAR